MMSWDVIVQDLPTDASHASEIPDDFRPRPLELRRTQVISVAADLAGSVEASDPAWTTWTDDAWVIEMNLGDDEHVDSFAIHARGNLDRCQQVIEQLLKALGTRGLVPGGHILG